MQTDSRPFPVWLWYAILCIFWWGLWGFLSKVGSEVASPMQMQILFTLHAAGCHWNAVADAREARSRPGRYTYGLLCGVATGLGTLGYYAALREQNASVVTL
jgi:uncharacterized membrane protein